jgi:hypothetical protein
MILIWGNISIRRRTTPSVTLCTRDPTCTSLESNSSFQIERPATNRLRHGNVAPIIVIVIIIIIIVVVVALVVVVVAATVPVL